VETGAELAEVDELGPLCEARRGFGAKRCGFTNPLLVAEELAELPPPVDAAADAGAEAAAAGAASAAKLRLREGADPRLLELLGQSATPWWQTLNSEARAAGAATSGVTGED